MSDYEHELDGDSEAERNVERGNDLLSEAIDWLRAGGLEDAEIFADVKARLGQ